MNEENIFLKFYLGPDKVFDLTPTYSHINEKSRLYSSLLKTNYYKLQFD